MGEQQWEYGDEKQQQKGSNRRTARENAVTRAGQWESSNKSAAKKAWQQESSDESEEKEKEVPWVLKRSQAEMIKE